MPTQRDDRAGQQLLDRAAAFLREDPARRDCAGLQHDHVAEALAELLVVLGEGMAELVGAVTWQARQSARVLLGETMASPATRGLDWTFTRTDLDRLLDRIEPPRRRMCPRERPVLIFSATP